MSEAIMQESTGMTLRIQAAIKLCQPSSGIDWLDAMILKEKRDWFAGRALAGELSAEVLPTSDTESKALAALCYRIADAMLAERDK